jgi:hypothetical protein
MLHPAVPTVDTANEYSPVPDPPDAPRVKTVPYTPLVVVRETVACVALVIVIVVASEDRALKTLSPSRVAITLQVPTDVNDNKDPVSLHDADPVSDTEYDKDPEPEPPEMVKSIGVP